MLNKSVNLRVDVDYAYPSRLKSFCAMALGGMFRCGDYLANAKTIAKMVNTSLVDVGVYWFFTKFTLPDKELLALLNNDRHVVGLHLVNDAESELHLLEAVVGREVEVFSIHGTDNFFSQLLWGREVGQCKAIVPVDFRLRSIHSVPTESLDFGCVNAGSLLSLHPDWLFRRSRRGCGPTVGILKKLLGVNCV